MNFKQLEMVGFKSFADPIKIVIEEGITAIVGPNGCGKSNVADAVKWVLGEQSSKNLRGTNMQDVIFKGTEKRKGQSFCEVSLLFDNQNKIFNSPFDEILITRKLYKTGESEYRINNTPSRLKEIVALLHDSGIGKSGYSIISQGMVGQIVNSKPEDRRAIFEEAAGIAGCKFKKTEAERRLDKTKINLDTINNVIMEIDRQLKPLKNQSETAKVFLDLKEKLKLLEVNAYIYQYDYAKDNKQQIQDKIDAILEEMNFKQSALNKSVEQYNTSFSQYSGIDEKVKELNEKILNLTIAIEKRSGQSVLIKEKLKNIKLENERLSFELEKLGKYRDDLSENIDNASKTKRAKESNLYALRSKSDEINSKFVSISNELQAGENEALDTQRRLFESLNKLGDVKARRAAFEAERKTYHENISQTIERLSELTNKLAELEKLEGEGSESLQKIERNKHALEDKVNELMRLQNETLYLVKQKENELQQISSNLLTLSQRKRILEEMQKEFEGFSGSVRRLLLDAEKNAELKKNIVGVIATLIDVPQNLQTAIEMALGSAVQNVVTETENQAKQLIDYLKRKEYGRITFLPIGSVKPRFFDNRFASRLSDNGVLGVAKDLITFDRKIDDVMSSLLGNTVVVDNINNAIALAGKTGYSFRIVTLDGDILSPQGSITGGSKKTSNTNILSRDTEIKNMEESIAKLEIEKQKFSEIYEDLLELQTDRSNDLKEATAKMRETELVFTKESEIANQYKLSKNDLQISINRHEGELGKYKQILEGIENELSKINGEQPEIDLASDNINDSFSSFGHLKAKRDEYSNELTQIKVEIAGFESEIAALKNTIESLLEQQQKNDDDINRMSNQFEENKSLLMQHSVLAEESQTNLAANEDFELLKETKQKLLGLEEEKSHLQENLRVLDSTRLTLTSEVNRLQDRKYQQDIALNKIDTDIETMQERVWVEYELTYNSALEYRKDVFDLKAGLQEISKIRRDISALGNVNVNAIEDYKLLLERHGTMYEEAQDLLKAEGDIKKIIAELESEMKTKFMTEFDKINSNFSAIFKELFGGGHARLELVNSDNVLEAGVEIMAEPPEKKLKNTQLLSGGEKALVAIAILFAIIRLKPLPFCLLDEIEAPLDEANVYRFVQYLKRYSHETQFIVITHKKPTMEYADTLYGITMEEKGVSKVVSVKLSDAVKMSEK